MNDILKKHGAAGKEELGQAQFAQLLQHVLQELADSLAKKPVVVVLRSIKLANGSKLGKVTFPVLLPKNFGNQNFWYIPWSYIVREENTNFDCY